MNYKTPFFQLFFFGKKPNIYNNVELSLAVN